LASRTITLIDCNSFYVSCERLFRPDLICKPVVVLSNNDGCIISRSDEAKKLGIKMGEPYFKAKDIILKNKVYVFSSNYALYGDISRRVMSTLKNFSLSIECYSIDEAFLDLSHVKPKNLVDYILKIKQTILTWTGIPVSIGVATTKTLSKVANHLAKIDMLGVKEFINKPDNEINEILKKIPVSEIWGIGRRLTKFFNSNNINNAYELKNVDCYWLRKNSNVIVLKTINELRGISCFPIVSGFTPRKNCCVSRSFGKRITSYKDIQEAVINHCLNAAEKIRMEKQIVKTIFVFLRTSPFKKKSYYFKIERMDLPNPTDNSIVLSNICIKALKRIFIQGYSYQKAGVIFSNLRSKSSYDIDLFNHGNDKLMNLMDKTNSGFGYNAVTLADASLKKNWIMKKNYSSKIDTSFLPKVPVIKAI